MSSGATDVVAWWVSVAATDAEAAEEKLKVYGSRDLTAIGDDLAAIAGWDDCPDKVKAELGVAFYLRGKVARMMGAYCAHTLPSDDTWHDASCYTMMARRIRAEGEWE